jgi:Transposase DDE domain group 1
MENILKNLVDSSRYMLAKRNINLTNEVRVMIKQTVLPFKLEITKDMITPHAGLALFGEFVVGLGLLKAIDKDLPAPGSGAGYDASEHIFPLILMLNGGGRSLEDLRKVREDQGLREVLGLGRMPSSDATGDWLRRSGLNGSLEGLAKVNCRAIKRGLKYDGIKGYTLDIDATGIEADKESAMMTYKGHPGYMPMAGHLAGNGLVLGDEFRQGNEAPASRNLEFIRHCEKQLPRGKHIKAFRADSASYQAEIINYCYDRGIEFAIGADLDKAVVRQIKSLGDSDWRVYQNGFIAETVHCMNKSRQAFRLAVIRRPVQERLFDKTDETERYTAIATNRTEEVERVIQWYNQRGQCSENRIKELKIGFGIVTRYKHCDGSYMKRPVRLFFMGAIYG